MTPDADHLDVIAPRPAQVSVDLGPEPGGAAGRTACRVNRYRCRRHRCPSLVLNVSPEVSLGSGVLGSGEREQAQRSAWLTRDQAGHGPPTRLTARRVPPAGRPPVPRDPQVGLSL